MGSAWLVFQTMKFLLKIPFVFHFSFHMYTLLFLNCQFQKFICLKSTRERENLPSVDLLPQCLQQPGLGRVEAGIWELSPALACGCHVLEPSLLPAQGVR